MSSHVAQRERCGAASIGTYAPLAMIGLLGLEYLLGMAINLYVELPVGGASTVMASGGPSPLLAVHMMLGMALAVGAMLTLLLAYPHGRRAIAAAALALGGIVLAGIAGMVFFMSGESNLASYLMALGFLVALGGYLAAFLTIRDASLQ